MTWIRSVIAVVMVAGVGAFAAPGVAHAADPVYGTWVDGGTWTSNVAGFPNATYSSNSAPVAAPAQSAFLNAATPFGTVYGSSQGRNYLLASTGAMNVLSVTTITFDGPTPPGFGIAFADIDADQLTILATGPNGPLDVAELGFRSTFNYCQFGSPFAPNCNPPSPPTDVPNWEPANSRLRGNVADTTGASAWFQPTQPITSMTLSFERISASGKPIFQTWFATPANAITGTIVPVDDSNVPSDTVISLVDDNDLEVAETNPAPDGTFEFPAVVPDVYTLVVEPPADSGLAPTTQVFDASAGDPPPVTIALQVAPPTTTTAPPTSTTSTTVVGPTTSRPRTTIGPGTLPATGSGDSRTGAMAFALLAAGVVLLVASRRRGGPVERGATD